MSAVLKPSEVLCRPMQEQDLDVILTIEGAAYEFPWTRAIFEDCLKVGYCCWVLEQEDLISGYSIVSIGAGEAHILNLCVTPELHGLGLGRCLLDRMMEIAGSHGAQVAFLEVRPSNHAAQALYHGAGFNECGVRRAYYPAHGGREDAIIMARNIRVQGHGTGSPGLDSFYEQEI